MRLRADKVDDGGDVVKAVNPLTPLRTLTTHIDDGELHFLKEPEKGGEKRSANLNGEVKLADTGRFDTSAEHIILRWNKVFTGKSRHVLEIAEDQRQAEQGGDERTDYGAADSTCKLSSFRLTKRSFMSSRSQSSLMTLAMDSSNSLVAKSKSNFA